MSPSSSRRRTAGAISLAVLAATVAAAQESRRDPAPGAVFGERIEVELVGVEVWVEDAEGRPVHGLTAGDFEVRHDGKPVEVSHFREIRSGAVVPTVPVAESGSGEAGAPAPGAAEPGHLVLYFDQLRLDPGGYRAVLEGVREVLAGGAVPAERILVLRQDTGLHVEAPFGSSAAEIEAALEQVAAGSHSGLAAAAELQQARDAILEAWEQSQSLSGSAQQGLSAAAGAAGGGPGGGDTGVGSGPRAAVGGSGGAGGSIMPSACDIFHQRAQPVVDAWIRDRGSRISITLAHLGGTAGFLSGLPGVKTLLYVSDGLDVEPGAALAAYVSDFCPTRSRDHELRALAESLSRDFTHLAAHFNAHRVTLHAVQGSGLRGTGAGFASERGTSAPAGGRLRFESRQRQSDRSGMVLLAGETGGRAVFNQNDLTGELAAIGRDMTDYYSLAYPPPARRTPKEGRDRGEGGESRIEVTPKDRSLTVRHRHGFRAPDPDEQLAERLAGALHLGIVSNPHDLRLGMGEPAADGAGAARDGTAPLRLYAMVPVDRLVFVPGEGGDVAHVELHARVQSPGDEPPAAVRRELRLHRPSGAADERVSLPLELDLGPGAHRVAVALRDAASGETSFVTTAFEISP